MGLLKYDQNWFLHDTEDKQLKILFAEAIFKEIDDDHGRKQEES